MRAIYQRATVRGAVVLLLLLLAACGGGTSVSPDLSGTTGDSTGQSTAGDTDQLDRNRLVASMPSPSGLSAGDEFEFTLSCELIEELYACSGRITYDSSLVEPVSADWGALVPGDAVTMVKLDGASFVPFAFTALQGHSGCAAGAGELLTLRFRVTGASAKGMRIRLRNDAEYLQLRDRLGQRLSFDLANEVTP